MKAKTIILHHIPGSGTGTSRIEVRNKDAKGHTPPEMVFKTNILNRILPFIPDLHKTFRVTMKVTELVELDNDSLTPITQSNQDWKQEMDIDYNAPKDAKKEQSDKPPTQKK